MDSLSILFVGYFSGKSRRGLLRGVGRMVEALLCKISVLKGRGRDFF